MLKVQLAQLEINVNPLAEAKPLGDLHRFIDVYRDKIAIDSG